MVRLVCLLLISLGLPYWPWWRYQMEAFFALLALCAGNSPMTGEFPAQRLLTRSFDIFFDLRLNKRLSKQTWGWCYETPSRSLWRQRNGKPSKYEYNRPESKRIWNTTTWEIHVLFLECTIVTSQRIHLDLLFIHFMHTYFCSYPYSVIHSAFIRLFPFRFDHAQQFGVLQS